MRTVKIFTLPSHSFVDRVSGVDYVRITQPMKYLKDYEYKGSSSMLLSTIQQQMNRLIGEIYLRNMTQYTSTTPPTILHMQSWEHSHRSTTAR